MPHDPLDAEVITREVAAHGTRLAAPVEVHEAIDSTNTNIAARLATGAAGPLACLAETQTAGRGRHGRGWVSPRGCNIYLSIGLRSNAAVPHLPAFALVVAAEVAMLLDDSAITIKWPNDLLVDGAKLAGILCESSLSASGAVALTVGIGLNVAMAAEVGAPLARAWTTLERVRGRPVPRGELAASIIHRICVAFPRFCDQGLTPWHAPLRERDCLAGQSVSWPDGEVMRTGFAVGIADDGALSVTGPDGSSRALHAGEVTLAPRPPASAQ